MAQHLLFPVWVGASQLSDVPWFNRMKSDSPSLVFCLEFHLWLSPVFKYQKSVGFMVFLRNKAFYFPWPKRHSVGMFKSSGHKMWLENEKCIRVISVLIKQHWVPTGDGFLTAMHGWEQETKPPFPRIQQYDHAQKNPLKRNLSSFDSLQKSSLTRCCVFLRSQCVTFLTSGVNTVSHDVAAAIILWCYREVVGLSSVQGIRSLYYNMSFSFEKVNLKLRGVICVVSIYGW